VVYSNIVVLPREIRNDLIIQFSLPLWNVTKEGSDIRTVEPIYHDILIRTYAVEPTGMTQVE
jgi:hypothetical protein